MPGLMLAAMYAAYVGGVAVVRTTDLYRAVIPFIVIQLVGLLLIVRWPGLVTGLVD